MKRSTLKYNICGECTSDAYKNNGELKNKTYVINIDTVYDMNEMTQRSSQIENWWKKVIAVGTREKDSSRIMSFPSFASKQLKFSTFELLKTLLNTNLHVINQIRMRTNNSRKFTSFISIYQI